MSHEHHSFHTEFLGQDPLEPDEWTVNIGGALEFEMDEPTGGSAHSIIAIRRETADLEAMVDQGKSSEEFYRGLIVADDEPAVKEKRKEKRKEKVKEKGEWEEISYGGSSVSQFRDRMREVIATIS